MDTIKFCALSILGLLFCTHDMHSAAYAAYLKSLPDLKRTARSVEIVGKNVKSSSKKGKGKVNLSVELYDDGYGGSVPCTEETYLTLDVSVAEFLSSPRSYQVKSPTVKNN